MILENNCQPANNGEQVHENDESENDDEEEQEEETKNSEHNLSFPQDYSGTYTLVNVSVLIKFKINV